MTLLGTKKGEFDRGVFVSLEANNELLYRNI